MLSDLDLVAVRSVRSDRTARAFDEEGYYLIEHHAFTYLPRQEAEQLLSSGRGRLQP